MRMRGRDVVARWVRWIPTLLLLGVFCSFAGVAWRGPIAHQIDSPTLPEVARRTGIAFPAGSLLLHSHRDRFPSFAGHSLDRPA